MILFRSFPFLDTEGPACSTPPTSGPSSFSKSFLSARHSSASIFYPCRTVRTQAGGSLLNFFPQSGGRKFFLHPFPAPINHVTRFGRAGFMNHCLANLCTIYRGAELSSLPAALLQLQSNTVCFIGHIVSFGEPFELNGRLPNLLLGV